MAVEECSRNYSNGSMTPSFQHFFLPLLLVWSVIFSLNLSETLVLLSIKSSIAPSLFKGSSFL